jgi:hypothetical protein
MRITNLIRGELASWVGACALATALLPVTRFARADDSPSLAQAISYEAADLWSGPAASGTVPESLTSAVYATPTPSLTPTPLDPAEDSGVEPAQACESCGDGGAFYWYNRCGCSTGLFPWFSGPGACDNWCVGPHWEVALDGMIMFREGVDFARIPPGAGFATELIDQFDEGPGARVFVTGYNDNNFGLQVGYEGINDFHANALFTNGAGASRAISYESNFNSIEINVVRRTESRWRPFFGARYIEIDDDFVDFTTVPKPLPPPANPAAPPTAFVDSGTGHFLDNRLIGVQAGVFRDVWRLNRWVTIEPWGNGGVYLNDFKRVQLNRTVTTIITGDDLNTPANEFTEYVNEVQTSTTREISELAFAGEAGVTGVFRLNRCVALRAGYQVLVVDRIGQGIDAFLAPGLNPSTLVYHGGTFGLEYVR